MIRKRFFFVVIIMLIFSSPGEGEEPISWLDCSSPWSVGRHVWFARRRRNGRQITAGSCRFGGKIG